MLSGRAKPAEAIHDGIIPANLGLAEAELMLGGKMGRELTLKKALLKVETRLRRDPDRLPAGARSATVNALVAADYALLSAEAQYFALQGVEQALEVIELARDSLNPGLQWLGVMLNIADMRTRHSREAFASLPRALRREVDRHHDPLVDRVRRIGRARRLDPRLPPRPRGRLPQRRR